MSQADEQQTDKRDTDESTLERERASGNKLWSVYISEAQSYDKGLIDGWRDEMDGMLLFAGLFSGVVATFIIDSYKTLNPDSGSQTVALLTQISLQLANMQNGTAATDTLPPATPFSPPVLALVYNALWFTSLALSLSSALVATLVKQWAQEYQHRTSMFSSPSVRARVYMYLYYGLRRFNMHAVVGVPPLLLHGALVLFFAGLVAFLVPVNIIIMGFTSTLLVLFVSVYGTFTILPLFSLDSPYQTPLTRILWSLNQSLGSVLRAYLRRATAVFKAFIRTTVALTDPEKRAESTVTNAEASAEPSATTDTRPQSQSIVDALKSAALRPHVKTETRALAWAVRSLSDDEELEKLVEGLPQTLWDSDRNKPRGVYQALFQSLLRDPEVHLCQRLADFMAGSNSNLLEEKDRVRRQISVLRAIWAVCAFSLHTGSPLPSPIGVADVGKALLGSKFADAPEVQSMLPDVSALVRLNIIKSRSWERVLTQARSSNDHFRAEAENQQQADMRQTYLDYLKALSKCPASVQRDVTTSFFDPPQMRFTHGDGFKTLQDALRELINSRSHETADNVVFAARQMITPFAQTSHYPDSSLWRLGPLLVRHPSLTASEPRSDSQPGPNHHYTRFLCHALCRNLQYQNDLQASVDALQLIYRNLLASDKPPRDLDTHLLVLHSLRTHAADIHTHRLPAVVQCVVLKSFSLYLLGSRDLSELAKLPSFFKDEAWFHTVFGLDSDKRTERALAQRVYGYACVGVVTTFFERCAARGLDQTGRDLDFKTLELVHHIGFGISSAPPTELQRRFANAVSGFIHKYRKNCLADYDGLYWLLFWAVNALIGWIKDLDALHVLDTAVSEVEADNQQQSHRDNVQRIRGQIQERILLSENNPANSVPLVAAGSDGEWRDRRRGCHFPFS